LAHHSFSAEFDVNRPITLTGTVTRVEWTNPHAWLFVETKDAEGNVQSWAIELLGINALMRRGVTRDSIKPGDVITVEGFGARDGTNTGNASAVTMTDTGEQLWASSAEGN
jgi:DNA/RNA endonuclease YhcR with UshA esterase domain